MEMRNTLPLSSCCPKKRLLTAQGRKAPQHAMRIPFSMLCQLALNHFVLSLLSGFGNERICHYTLVTSHHYREKKREDITHLEREKVSSCISSLERKKTDILILKGNPVFH
jgi:hypothetical protein